MMYSTPARQRTSQSRASSSAHARSTPRSRATPSNAQSRTTARTVNIPELPPYQAPEAPLNPDAQRQLALLIHSQEYKGLKVHLKHAADELTTSAGQVNEKLCDARIRYEKARESRRNQKGNSEEDENDEDSIENEELQRLGNLERKTDAVTGELEEKMRAVIDSETKMQTLADSIVQLEKEEAETQLASIGPRRTRAMRRRNLDEDEDGDEDHADENYEGTPEREMRERNATNPPSQRLAMVLSAESQKWKESTLTERYAGHNTYVGFYRMVHDAKFPNEEAPPLPHSSTWFEHLEDTTAASANVSSAGQTRSSRKRNQAADADDDIAIERERISMKCPLTLLPYQDPVTSTKCPHSFEREAIYDMIARSTMYSPAGAGRGRVRALKCPVCSITLTKDDLRPDPVLLRRVRRAEEMAAREAEDQLEGQSQLQGPNQVTLGSDAIGPDEMEVDVDVEDDAPVPSARVKSEPVERAVAVDSDEEGEDEEDEDDEEQDEDEEEDVEMDSDEE